MIDITVRIQSAVAQCLGVNVVIEPRIYITNKDLKELNALKLNDIQLYTFIYQTIQEGGARDGLYKLETDHFSFNLRLENKSVGEDTQCHLKLIKRIEMLGNRNASSDNTADGFLQIRVKKTDKSNWKEISEELGYSSLSAWVISTLSKSAEEHNKNKDIAS